MRIDELLRKAVALGASDLHIVPGTTPMVRVQGQLVPLPQHPPLTAEQCNALISPMMTEQQRKQFEQDWSLDFSLMLDDVRYRANVFFQRNGLEAVLRIIPLRIPTPEDLLLPPSIIRLTDLARGLVLVTGPTGSGKSTTLACLINLINQKRRANIITIEDPIEFLYPNLNSVVSQREIGQHAPNFQSALKYVLRQDPDVVLIGEMRDLETIAAALTVAETGHLVLATLHTADAPQAIDRIIDVFPSHQQQQIRTQVSGVLRAVISQTLIPQAQGAGRVAAREIMMVTPAVANLIRTAKTHELYSAIEMGVKEGMVSRSRALAELVQQGLIQASEAHHVTHGDTSGSKRRSTDYPKQLI